MFEVRLVPLVLYRSFVWIIPLKFAFELKKRFIVSVFAQLPRFVYIAGSSSQ